MFYFEFTIRRSFFTKTNVKKDDDIDKGSPAENGNDEGKEDKNNAVR